MRVDFLSGIRGIHAATKGASLPAPLEPPLAFLCSGVPGGAHAPGLWFKVALTYLCHSCCRQRLAAALSSHHKENCL
jgi:hypothetical protein